MSEMDREQQIANLLQRPYRTVIHGDLKEGYLAEVEERPGCLSAGASEVEALEHLREAMAAWFDSALIDGAPIPVPASAART